MTSTDALTTCSKLSSTNKSCFCSKYATNVSDSGSPGNSRTTSTRATDEITKPGSRTGAKDTKKTPLSHSSNSSAAACNASRVLPIPPGPVSVSSRTAGSRSNAVISLISRVRPTSTFG